MRNNLARATAVLQRAQTTLETFEAQANALGDNEDPALSQRIEVARNNLARAQAVANQAQAGWDATGDGMWELETQYAEAVRTGNTAAQQELAGRIEAAQATMNQELGQRRERWGADRSPDKVTSVTMVSRDENGNLVVDQQAYDLAQATGVKAWARHYPEDRDHPGGVWRVRMTRPDEDGNIQHLTVVLNDEGHQPTMRDVLNRAAQDADAITQHVERIEGVTDSKALQTLGEIDAWQKRFNSPPPQVAAKDMDHQPYAAWAIANGHLPYSEAAQLMRTQGRALGEDPRTKFTADQGEEYANALATRGVDAIDPNDEGWRNYLDASGNHQALVASQNKPSKELTIPESAAGAGGGKDGSPSNPEGTDATRELPPGPNRDEDDKETKKFKRPKKFEQPPTKNREMAPASQDDGSRQLSRRGQRILLFWGAAILFLVVFSHENKKAGKGPWA